MRSTRFAGRAASLLLALALAACTTDPPTDPLIAVVGVTIDGAPTDGVLLEDVTRTLTATVIAPGNIVLPDRQVAWSSSDQLVATIDADGKLRTQSVGETTIRARSESRTAELSVSVREGTTVPSNGNSRVANLVGNRLRLTVPVGVAPGGTVIHAREAVTWPANTRIVAGSVMEIGPAGTELAGNITVGITFVPADIPAAERSQLRLHAVQADGQWALLPSANVDLNNFRVSAGMSRLSTVAIFRAATP